MLMHAFTERMSETENSVTTPEDCCNIVADKCAVLHKTKYDFKAGWYVYTSF